MPKFKIEDVEDAYTLYVLIMGISEEMFWNAELSEILSIAENKTAYDNWVTYKKQEVIDEGR